MRVKEIFSDKALIELIRKAERERTEWNSMLKKEHHAILISKIMESSVF